MIKQESRKIKKQKEADHDTDVVIGKNGQGKAQRIEGRIALLHKNLQSQKNKRKEAIEPHHIPGICGDISGQRIKHPEKRCRIIISPKMLSKVDGSREAGKGNLQDN